VSDRDASAVSYSGSRRQFGSPRNPDQETILASDESPLRAASKHEVYAMADRDGTIFIVDDDAPVRDSLRRLMESTNHPVEVFASARQFLNAWGDQPGGVLVLDIRLPDMSGLALQAELAEFSSVLPIIFITGYGDVPTAVRAMRAGAFDFVEKPFRGQDLLDAVQAALAAGSSARQRCLEKQRVLERLARLTRRERQILGMMVEGKPNKVMASELNLSQRTVEVHRASVMRKMEVGSLAALVRAFLLVTDERVPVARHPVGVNGTMERARRAAHLADQLEAVVEGSR
jgi:FixJ family two-component response regulator